MRFDLRHAPRRRTAFILGYVVLMGILVGGLVFAYYQSFRARDAQVRRSGDAIRARFLARSAIEHLRFSLRERMLRAKPNPAPDVESGPWDALMLGDEPTLRKAFAARGPEGEDHREFVKTLLGPAILDPIDDITRSTAGAKVTYHLALKEVLPLAPETALKDPVMKNFSIEMKVRADVRQSSVTLAQVEGFRIYSVMPEGSSRFTLAVLGAVDHNSLRIDETGTPLDPGANPIVLVHHPEDGNPVTEDTFAPATDRRLGPPGGGELPAKAIDQMTGRGLVYMSKSADNRLNLASGHAPLGEYFSVFGGNNRFYPEAQQLEEQPGALEGLTIPDPRDPNVKQRPFIQGAVFGLYQDVNQEGLLDSLPPPPAKVLVSRLKVFGTARHPSTTLLLGKVYRRMAALSDVAMDRDVSGTDEADQAASTGGATLPERETIDPFLRGADEAAYTADLEREARNEALSTLKPFNSPALPPGRLINKNQMVDLDGDGVPEQMVASELLHQPLPIDRNEYRYGKFFAAYDEYRRFMSKTLELPANFYPHLAGKELTEARKLLSQLAFRDPGLVNNQDYLLEDFRLKHTSGLHKSFKEAGEGGTLYFDTGGMEASQVDTLLKNGVEGTRDIVVVRGQRAFEAAFMSGGQLDLQGLEVLVYGERPEDPSKLVFPGVIKVKRGGVLKVEELEVSGMTNSGTGPEFEPLQVRTSSLVIRGAEPVEGAFSTPAVTTTGTGTNAFLRGSLVAQGPAHLAASKPLVLMYDPRMDPTGPEAAAHYRGRSITPAAQYVLVEGSF